MLRAVKHGAGVLLSHRRCTPATYTKTGALLSGCKERHNMVLGADKHGASTAYLE